jgi:hypothetical protein
LGADEKHIRARSAILYKSKPKSSLFSSTVELLRLFLRGRRPVRADPRLRTDEKHIRAQSTISEKSQPKPHLPLSITAFSVRMRFLSVQKTRLARAARKLF